MLTGGYTKYEGSLTNGQTGCVRIGEHSQKFLPSSQPRTSMLGSLTADRFHAGIAGLPLSPPVCLISPRNAYQLPAHAPSYNMSFKRGNSSATPLICPYRFQLHTNPPTCDPSYIGFMWENAGLPLSPPISLTLPSNKYQLLARASS